MAFRYLCFIFLGLVTLPFSVHAQGTGQQFPQTDIYQQVKDRGVLRCGYQIWPPYFEPTPGGEGFQGLSYDIAEAIGDNIGLEINWALEFKPGEQVQALRSGKIDAICAGNGFSMPGDLTHSQETVIVPLYLYGPAEGSIFDNNSQSINDNRTRIAVIGGDITDSVAKEFYPLAGLKYVEATSRRDSAMRSVVSGAADLVISDKLSMRSYLQNYPGVLKTIVPKNTIARIPLGFSFLRGKDTLMLKDMIDEGIEYFWIYGQGDALLDIYDPNRVALLKAAN